MNVLVDLQKQTDCSASVLCSKIISVEIYFTGLLQTQSSHQNFIKSLAQLKLFTAHSTSILIQNEISNLEGFGSDISKDPRLNHVSLLN